jgi:acyl-CoA thioester hydrolase
MNRDAVFDEKLYKHWTTDHVRFSDLDPVGHVNNNAISQYFENARAFLYMTITPSWPRGDAFFVLARTAIDYRRELHMPADLRIGTTIHKIGRTSITVVNVLFRGTDGIAACESISVLIDQKTRQPLEISADLRQRCAEHML